MAVSITSITPDVPSSLTTQIKIAGVVRNDTAESDDQPARPAALLAAEVHRPAAMSAYQSDQNPATLPSQVSTRTPRLFLDVPALEAGRLQDLRALATPVQLGLTSFGVYRHRRHVARSTCRSSRRSAPT